MFHSLHFPKLYQIITLCAHLKNAKMAGRVAIETVKRNSDQAKEIIQELKSEVKRRRFVTILQHSNASFIRS